MDMNNLLYAQIFDNKIYTCGGYDFQYLFFEIMKNKYKEQFVMPKPQGRYGDKKNDGYIVDKGQYFAVYGPDSYDLNISYTISKMDTDLTGLIENINSGAWKNPVNTFIFVVNTRHNNILPVEIIQKTEELSNKYGIYVTVWTSYDLRSIFNELTEPQKQFILQCYVALDNITLNIQVLNKIIEKVNKLNCSKSKIDGIMEFEKKIAFNNLDDNRASDLLSASYSINTIDQVLDELDSTGLLQEQLSDLLRKIYEEAKDKLSDENQIFDYIISKLMETSSTDLREIDLKIIRETVLIIMSKYFENCTIFEKDLVIE